MVNLKEQQIKPHQLAFLVTQAQIGGGLLMLPAKVHSLAQGDAWISVLLGGLMSQLFIVIIWCLNKRFPSYSLYDFLPALLGRFMGRLVQLIYVAFFTLVTSFIIIRFARTIQNWVLIDTPRWVLIAMMTSLCIYLGRESLRTVSRFFNVVFVCNILVIIIIAFAYFNVNFLYVLPVGQAGLWNIAKGAFGTMDSLAGYEILLICYPFVEGGSTGKLKAVTLANTFTTLFYAYAVFTSLIVFSPPELDLLPQPLLYMVKALSFSVVERPDLYFLSLMMVVVTTTSIGYFIMASRGASHLFRQQGKHRKVVPYTAAVVFIIALVIKDPFQIDAIEKILAIAVYLLIFATPLVLLIISVLFKITEARRGTS